MGSSDVADWLLVPMEVSALVVGEGAGDGQKYWWSDLTPDYSKVSQDFALMGPDLVTLFPPVTDPSPPGAGIHLHWFLPEAFGRGVQNEQGAIHYPPIPNRWVVRRVRHAMDTCDIRDVAGWVVESDFLHETTSAAGETGAVSILQLARPVLFDSVGKATPLETWSESNPAYRFTLTALGSGRPDFPAYYPACKSVLGFHDPSPAGDEAGDWHVSYLVTGWCSDPQRDPLRGVTPESWPRRLAELQWSASGTAASRRVLCHGAATRIAWNRDHVHVSAVPTGPATVCVGNTSAEALATLLAEKMRPGGTEAALLEPLLCAFQYDMLGSSRHLGDVHAELHAHRFTSTPGADRYAIDAKRIPLDAAGAADPPEAPSPVPRLPHDIESALDDLNALAREAARRQHELGSLRQELFTTWCRWARNYIDARAEPTALTAELTRRRDTVAAAARAAETAQTAHETARDRLTGILAARLPDLELARSTESPFYRATDPVILVAGRGFAPSGGSEKYLRSDAISCRRATEIVAGLSADIENTGQPISLSAGALFPQVSVQSWPALGDGPPSDLLEALLRELLVLDPADPRDPTANPPSAELITAELDRRSPMKLSDTTLAYLNKAIAELLKGTKIATQTLSLAAEQAGVTPRRPDAGALTRWTANPWRPLLLAWEVAWHPDPGLAGAGDVAPAWTPWSLDEQGNEFQWADPADPAPSTVTYKSYTILAPRADWVLRRRLEAYGRESSRDVSHIISAVDTLEVLAQSLGGFHDALRQLRHGLQLPPINPAYVIADSPPSLPQLDAIAEPIDGIDPLDPQHMHAPDFTAPDQGFLPIRAGQLEIGRLWLVDSFGQTLKLIDGDSGDYELMASFGLPGPSRVTGSPRLIPLPPRYVQPARLDFRWLSATADQPGGNPLCGWIFPNHLDKSLMICDAAGRLWGAVQQIIRVSLSGGTGGTQGQGAKAFFWVPVPGTEATPADIPDVRMQAFVRYLLDLGADAGPELLRIIAAAQQDTGPAPEHDARLSILVGRPLALARASLRIDLMGLPATRVPGLQEGETGHPARGDLTRGFTRVHFPIRLGGPEGDAGGLAGYFVDGESGSFHPRHGLTGRDFPGHLEYGHQLVLDAERAVELTLLLDPAAPVHARCGFLPRHSLHLPAAVAARVSSIRDVFFQGAPLVGPPGGPRVPRPSDDYGQWSWAVRPRVTYWQEYAEITDPGDRSAFGQNPVELQEGWLKLAMNPVSVAAFWVKEGSATVAAGTRVTLGWMVEGAETLSLSVQGSDQPLASWSSRRGAGLPQEYRIQVSQSMRVSLAATDGQGNRSVKSLRLEVTSGGEHG